MNVFDNNDWKDIENFPQNRTLYADQFTEDGPTCDEERRVYQAGNIEEAFLFYKPCMDIALQDEEGESVTEHFTFRATEDFEDSPLVTQSELLSALEQKIEDFNNRIYQLERNKSLCNSTSHDEDLRTCIFCRDKAEARLHNNLSIIHEALLPLEIAYRTLDTFYANAGQENVPCIHLMNVRKNELKTSNSDDTLAIAKELKKYYDRLDTKTSYSLLVIPGYLGSASTVRSWASIAFKNKVILVTDFEDCKSFKDLKEALAQAGLQGQYLPLSNVVMTCNYIIGRKKSEWADENDDVYLPGSGALAGRMANVEEVNIAQGVSGREYGVLDKVNDTRLNLLRSEIEALIGLGVIPLVEDDGHTMAYSNHSLYNGSTPSLQEYPIVRVFDWVKKVLMNYMHEITLETWNPYTSSQRLKGKINEFLNHYRGYKNLFSNYKLGEPTQNSETKVVTVDISITPFFVGKNFTIKLKADEKKNIDADTLVEG